jgi:hypothetical protein
MPDIGGLGRGLLKGALSATEKAAEKVKDAAETASRKLSDSDPPDVVPPHSDLPDSDASRGDVSRSDARAVDVVEPGPSPEPEPEPVEMPPGSGDDESADASDVRELVELFQQLLASRRPPEGPVQGKWSLGVGDLLGEHPRVPKRVRGLVSRLNRFGGVSFSPEEIAFDGDDVAWETVTEVRTRHVVDYLVGDAVQQQVENLPVPWFPGRGKLLDALGQALLTVTIATAKDQLDKLSLDVRVPAEIVYKASFGRSKELNAGVVSALVLADPAVNRSLIATAQARGITVTAGDDELLANADERAEQVRAKVRALEAELDRFTRRFGRRESSAAEV